MLGGWKLITFGKRTGKRRLVFSKKKNVVAENKMSYRYVDVVVDVVGNVFKSQPQPAQLGPEKKRGLALKTAPKLPE